MQNSILQYLEDSAARTPDKVAFADVDKSYTYRELQDKAKRIGSFLAPIVEKGDIIPVFMEKCVEAIAVFMGIAYAGCGYAVLDVKQPVFRLHQIIDTLGAKILICREEEQPEAEKLDFQGECLSFEKMCAAEIDEAALAGIRRQALDIDPLYAIFTSGSTGVPKGVLVSHRSVIDFIECFTGIFGIEDTDIIGNQAPFDFDVSVKDIYSTLKMGATMQIIPKAYFSTPVKLLDFLCDREVTVIIWAVSALCIITTLKAFRYKVPTALRKIMFSGEVMPIKHLNEWRRNIPDAMYVNLYGPTEITCNCTYYILDREFENGEMLPIGIPFPNEKVFLLDDEDRLVTTPGKEGEICVSGTALALGYYNNWNQTNKAFVQNPLNHKYLETIYRTGDLGVYDENGELFFQSRKDFQIKHMGHRIELSEIDIAIEENQEVIRACSIYDQDHSKIVAFYQGDIDKMALVQRMSQKIPDFMKPNVLIQVDEMPLNKNGKIDRKQLTEQYKAKTFRPEKALV